MLLSLFLLNSKLAFLQVRYLRRLLEEDIEELKNLHEEWFPLVYGRSFYERIHKSRVIAIGCFYDVEYRRGRKKVKESIILGSIMVKVQEG